MTPSLTQSKWLFTLMGFCIALVVSSLFIHAPFVSNIDHKILDAQFSISRQMSPESVLIDPIIVGIDENFLDSIDEPFALSHVYIAQFLSAMNQASPRVVGIDLVLPEKRFNTLASTKDPQRDFHKTLLAGLLQTVQQTPLIVAKTWDQDRRKFHDIQVDYAAVLGMQDTQSQPLASALFCPDSDHRIRRFPLEKCLVDQTGSSFSGEIGAAMGVRKSWSGLINYRIGEPFSYIPIQEVLDLEARGDTERLKQLFSGKAVLLGTTLDDVDVLELPVPLAKWRPQNHRVPGVLAHAQILRSMLNQGLIQPLSMWWVWALCSLFALFWFGASIIVKLQIFFDSVLAVLAASYFLLQQGYWLPPGALLLTGLCAFGGRSLLQGWRHFSDKQRLSRVFSGYVSPVVMKEIISGGLDHNKQSRNLHVCVLFADIRSFTALCEHMQAQEVVGLLNRYFSSMVSVIHRNGGTVDKFMGDGLMAFFGAPNTLVCPEKNALDAAHEMLIALKKLNLELVAEGRLPFHIGIGLHSGTAVIGQIGSDERHEYTAIGDTVNTASRLEGLSKDAGYSIICSSAIAEAVGKPEFLLYLGEKPLKGHSPIVVYGCQPVL